MNSDLPWGKIVLGVAALTAGGVALAVARGVMVNGSSEAPKRSEEDILAERYLRQLQAASSY